MVIGGVAAMKPTILDRAQLQDRADRGVRRIALALLRNADAASDKLLKTAAKQGKKSTKADDALHDFRVAVRRLRSWTRAFRPLLQGSLSRKQRRHLREIFQDTGVARDASVHLAWMRDQRKTLNAQQRIGHDWLSGRLKADQEAGWITALSAAGRFDALSLRLARRLNEYCSEVDDERLVRIGAVIARRLLDDADGLRDALEAVDNVQDEVPIHRARIAAKRLRYLAEQVASLAKGGDTLLEALEHVQDTLGDLHDVHVFSPTLAHHSRALDGHGQRDVASRQSRATGMLALTQRLHERGQRAFGVVERDWLAGRASPFFARVRAMADEISWLARLGTEIEHKYLLSALPEKALAAESVEIRQGYLPGEHLVERIRCTGTVRSRQRWTRTVKTGEGMKRVEIEDDTNAAMGRAMWRLTRGRRIHKRRYTIREDDGAIWQVDEFLDRLLILAEIELESEDDRPNPPDWLQHVIERDVTEESEYTNASLAK
jgi:CHAD domain-containing protein/CYTH domain-containing protein